MLFFHEADDELQELYLETKDDGESFEEWFETGFYQDSDVPDDADENQAVRWLDDNDGTSFTEWVEGGDGEGT